ncbi:MAG: type II toxin-antitoxin system mRNA interferase toxin, RelE/StbE family [Candidatus Paceibacterota bacterium]|jgi:addiction module RelE/StbE family toxin
MTIVYTSKFEREYKHLPEEVKDLAEQKQIIFQNNPFDAPLNTHKLKGKMKDYWSWSINYKYRIIFYFKNKKEVWYLSVGDHDIYC